MLIKIRKGVFETNSSSMHSICISKEGISGLKYPKKVFFKHGEFDRERKNLETIEDKASYLYQSICSLYEGRKKEEMINRIYEVLGKYGIEAEFEEEKVNEYGFQYGHIEHAYEGDMEAFCECTVWNEKDLMRYLFSKRSFVMTGSDEVDYEEDLRIHVPYKHKEYYKGFY